MKFWLQLRATLSWHRPPDDGSHGGELRRVPALRELLGADADRVRCVVDVEVLATRGRGR